MKSRSKKILVVILLIIILVLVFGYYAVNKRADGILDYYLWKTFSSNSGKGQSADINDIKIYYEIHGKGEPLLLLHGGTAFIECFYKMIPGLADKFQVIAVDSRGHGRSTDSVKPLSYELMADDMFKLLKKLDISNVYIVGWSDGGIIGLDLAMSYPALVRKLVVIGTNFRSDGLKDEDQNFFYNATPDLEYFSKPRKFYETIAPHPDHWPVIFEKIIQMWKTQPNYSLAQLKTIQSPVLIIVGENGAIKIEHTKEMAKTISKSRLFVVPESTHMVPMEKPEVLNREIICFLKD